MSSLSYSKVWKWIAINWSEFFTFYWKDFNPTVPAIPTWNTATVYNETSTFNLSGFQPWHEVGCYVWNVTCTTSGTLYVEATLQSYRSWWQTEWSFDWEESPSSWDTWMWYMYFWVDYDEIRDYATSYRILTNRSLGSDSGSWIATPFSITWLNIDSTRHTSGYLRVEWTHLCYIDASYTHNSGYKHTIAYDSWFSGWTWEPGYIWIPNSSWDKAIHYIDANGRERRTYYSDAWYWGTSYANNPGYIRVSDGDTEDGYAHLCFVDSTWQKRRLLNWPV